LEQHEIDPNYFIQWLVFFVATKSRYDTYGKRIIDVINSCVEETLAEAIDA